MKHKLINNKKTIAFTLAEVLITLTVIGVIAAITVPVITANHRRIEASSRIKKFYSMLQNASTKAKAEGNDWNYWAESASTDYNEASSDVVEQFGKEYLDPYINYNQKVIDGKNVYYYLDDGTYFFVYKGTCIDFNIDVNGDKKPNQGGRDIFKFLYCPASDTNGRKTETVIPYQTKTASITTREQALSYCKSNGDYCSALLSFDGWEFKKDYPYGI